MFRIEKKIFIDFMFAQNYFTFLVLWQLKCKFLNFEKI